MESTPEDVKWYLEAVLGYKPAREPSGMMRIPCVWPVPVCPPHDALMDPNSGRWHCEGNHGGGDMATFEMGRARILDHGQAEEAVLRIIAEAKERARQEEEAARTVVRGKRLEALPLPPYLKGLLRIIYDHAEGISRRELQQRSHLRSREFNRGLEELDRRGRIRSERVLGRGRSKTVYFPLNTEQLLT